MSLEVRDRLRQADELKQRAQTLEHLAGLLSNTLITRDMHWYDGLLWWKADKREGAVPRQEFTREEARELREMIPALVREKRKKAEELEASVSVLD